jgi:hypothetical protein
VVIDKDPNAAYLIAFLDEYNNLIKKQINKIERPKNAYTTICFKIAVDNVGDLDGVDIEGGQLYFESGSFFPIVKYGNGGEEEEDDDKYRLIEHPEITMGPIIGAVFMQQGNNQKTNIVVSGGHIKIYSSQRNIKSHFPFVAFLHDN